MNKKILFGCLFVFVLFTVAGAAGFYFFVYKPIGGYIGSAMQLAEVSELNEKVDNRASYAAPADGRLTEDQVTRFVSVQRSIRTDLDARFVELERKYDELQANLNRQGRDARLSEVLGAWRDVTSLIVQAKRAQVTAINQERFSLDEYYWVRDQFYTALGAEVFAFRLDNSFRFENADDRAAFAADQPFTDVPEENRRLVEPYAENADQWITFAWFGL